MKNNYEVRGDTVAIFIDRKDGSGVFENKNDAINEVLKAREKYWEV